MKDEEEQKKLKSFIKYISELGRMAELGLTHYERMKEQRESYEEKIKVLKEKMKSEEKIKWSLYSQIEQLKESHPDFESVQCPACDGAGGHSWSDEYGNGDGEICGGCRGTGWIFIDKKDLQEEPIKDLDEVIE